jgi:hypothetical protein
VNPRRPQPIAFVLLQIDKEGRLNLFRLSFDDGQAHEFRRDERIRMAIAEFWFDVTTEFEGPHNQRILYGVK